MKKIYDVIIIGAGPAGMNAAIYSSRMGMKVAIVEGGLPGGQMNNTDEIENYIGYQSIKGPELSELMDSHVSKFVKNEDKYFGTVEKVTKENGLFFVKFDDSVLISKTVVLATGCVHKELGVKGETRILR